MRRLGAYLPNPEKVEIAARKWKLAVGLHTEKAPQRLPVARKKGSFDAKIETGAKIPRSARPLQGEWSKIHYPGHNQTKKECFVLNGKP
jgi:hypothetical protein